MDGIKTLTVKELNLKELIRKTLEKAMGKTLDTFRITDIGERQMKQVERTMRDYFNELITYQVRVLEEYGYIEKQIEEEIK